MEQDGLTLLEALKHYSIAELWQEYEGLQKYRLTVFWVGGPEHPDEKKHWRLLKIEHQLQQELQNKLIRGELIASAYEYPVSVSSKRVVVPRDKWTFLEPDFDKSAASAAGLQLVELRIFDAKGSSAPKRGRKTDALSKRADIHAAFDQLVSEGKVRFVHGGLQKATQLLAKQFPTYKPDSIRSIIQESFKEHRSKNAPYK